MGLANASLIISQLEYFEDALWAAREATHRFRDLARCNPTYEVNYAMMMINRGTVYNKVGMRSKAYLYTKAAVILISKIRARNPGSYDDEYAMALGNLANRLSGRKS